MKLRTLKRRHDARTLHRWHFLADLRAEMMIEDWQWEPCDDWDDEDDMPDDACLHCRGDGMDPDCDYLLPCPDCGEVM